MSESAEVSTVETAPGPSVAEFFDPAALEARLVEARARRAEALARRAAGGGEADSPVRARTARVRTVDMAAVAAPGIRDAGHAARPLGIAPVAGAKMRGAVPAVLPPSPAPAGVVPRAKTAAAPLHGDSRGETTMPERLAAAVAALPAPVPAPKPAPPAPARWHRHPLAVLGLGVAAGVMVAGATLLALRAPSPDKPAPTAALAPGTTRSAAVERSGLRFAVPVPGDPAAAPGAVALGYGLSGGGAAGPVADAASETRRDAAATSAVPRSAADSVTAPPSDAPFAALRATDAPPVARADVPALRRTPTEAAVLGPGPAVAAPATGFGYAALAPQPAVPASPAADAAPRLETRAAPSSPTRTEPLGAEPGTSATRARERGHLAPSPPQTVVAALPELGPPLRLELATAPRLRDGRGLRRTDPVGSARFASARSPAAFRPPIAALQMPPEIAADAVPRLAIGDEALQPRLRYPTGLPDDGTVSSLAWPGGLAAAPAVAYALLEPQPEKPAPAADRRAAAGARGRSAPQPAADRSPAPVRNAVADAVARAHLERSVEDMLRDRLLRQ